MASTSAAPTSAYTPPSADQLYQLVAPIALFPDKLVAQVLAGSTYPDQITAADNLLVQSPNLKGTLLQAAVDPQPWDASVKGLTAFPSTLDQMAKNIQWTTALGEAYVNDPTDVLNAVQVMRQRASAHGNLRSTQQQRVETRTVEATAPDDAAYVQDSGNQPVYSGPSVVPAPEQVIEIEPAQPDTVYVPSYDPQAVYGGDVGYYPSYTYERPSYSGSDLVAVGAVTFGVAILVGAMRDHHRDGGDWHAWGMNWGGRGGGGGNEGGGGWRRPAVVYNNQTYVSRSTTVVNRYTTNNITNINSNNRTVTNNNGNIVNNRNTINNTNNTNNSVNNSHNQFAQNREVPNRADNRPFDHRNVPNSPTPAAAPGQPNHMTMPNFSQARQPAAANNAHPVAAHAAAPQPHEAPPRAEERHAPAARPQETLHQPAAVTHAQPQRPAQLPHAAPAPHPAMAQPRPAEHVQQAPHPQPEAHTQPAPHPQPHPQPMPRPQPESRPAPQHESPQPHPAPQQNHPQKAAPPHPEKKDDKDHH